MPTCVITHRQRTGLFTGVLISILGKSAARHRRLNKYRGIKCEKTTVKVAIAVLFFELLLLCGDVESNPGPGPGPRPWEGRRELWSNKDFPPLPRRGAWVRGPSNNSGSHTNTGSGSEDNYNDNSGGIKNSNDYKTKMSFERLHQEVADTLNHAVGRLEAANKQHADDFNQRVDDMENNICRRLSNIEEQQRELKINVGDLHSKYERLVAEHEYLYRDLQQLKRKNDYMENQSRRNNLIFIGIPPVRDGFESWSDCQDKVLTIIREGMQICEDVHIERAHRVGKTIIVKFMSYISKTLVLSRARELRHTKYFANIFVREDFSKPVREQREILINLQRRLRQQGRNPRLRFDKLLDGGAVYHVDDDGQVVERRQGVWRSGGDDGGVWQTRVRGGEQGRGEEPTTPSTALLPSRGPKGRDTSAGPVGWHAAIASGRNGRTGHLFQQPSPQQRVSGPYSRENQGSLEAVGQTVQPSNIFSAGYCGPQRTKSTPTEHTQQHQPLKNSQHTHWHDDGQKNALQDRYRDLEQMVHYNDHRTVHDGDKRTVIDSHDTTHDDTVHSKNDENRSFDDDENTNINTVESNDDILERNSVDGHTDASDRRNSVDNDKDKDLEISSVDGTNKVDELKDVVYQDHDKRNNIDNNERENAVINRQDTSNVTKEDCLPEARPPDAAGAADHGHGHGSGSGRSYNLRSRGQGATADQGPTVNAAEAQSKTPARAVGGKADGASNKGRAGRGRSRSPASTAQPRIDVMFRQQPPPHDPCLAPLPLTPPPSHEVESTAVGNVVTSESPLQSDTGAADRELERGAINDSDGEEVEFEDATDIDSP